MKFLLLMYVSVCVCVCVCGGGGGVAACMDTNLVLTSFHDGFKMRHKSVQVCISNYGFNMQITRFSKY